jgi:ribosomal protein S18 acetylase RimI-like enzyme
VDISIEIGKVQHLDPCYESLINSSLGDVYFNDKNPRGMLAGALERGEIFVALKDKGSCIGFLWHEIKGTFGKYPYLHIIAIDRDYQSMGVGKKLIGYFEDISFKDFDKVFLMVGDFNRDARRLYGGLGYIEVGVMPDFYLKGVNEHLMMKTREQY